MSVYSRPNFSSMQVIIYTIDLVFFSGSLRVKNQYTKVSVYVSSVWHSEILLSCVFLKHFISLSQDLPLWLSFEKPSTSEIELDEDGVWNIAEEKDKSFIANCLCF